jgi:hypothetical protein
MDGQGLMLDTSLFGGGLAFEVDAVVIRADGVWINAKVCDIRKGGRT